ncbi:MAG TPA: ThuA domain-containing protein, partial [Verrucomicrobiae bacterium]|nr:ThuA domain-containing protein [Verrucomicrobiae bacterium]
VTDPHPQPADYALTLPGIKRPRASGPGTVIDVDYDLGTTMNRSDWISFARTLPKGREIAKAMSEKLLLFKDPPMAHYPYIHPGEPAGGSGLASDGDFERGRALFFGEQLKCYTCHRIRGEGGTVGPDLSNLVAKDPASVLRDIKEPSASINPDYVAYHVSLKDGSDMTGFVRSQNEHLLGIVGTDGKTKLVPRNQVEQLVPSSVSLMPEGLLTALKRAQVRDLLTFLLNAPPERTPRDIASAISGEAQTSTARHSDALQLVLVASKQDHGPHQHDYPAWQKTWHALLASTPQIHVEDAWLWPSDEQWQHADVIALYYWNHAWTPEKFSQMDAFLARGGGIVLLHAATIGNPFVSDLAKRIGLAADSGKTKYRHTPFDLTIAARKDNPIMRGFPKTIHFLDEPYWPMVGDTNKIQVLATAQVDGRQWPMVWTLQSGKGRVFASIPGHYTATLKDPWYRLLVFRGIAWAADRPTDAFDFLAAKDETTRISELQSDRAATLSTPDKSQTRSQR